MKTVEELITEIADRLKKPFSVHNTGSVWVVRTMYKDPQFNDVVGYGNSLLEALSALISNLNLVTLPKPDHCGLIPTDEPVGRLYYDMVEQRFWRSDGHHWHKLEES